MGYSQNLWLLGDDHLLTEVGTMNSKPAFPSSFSSLPPNKFYKVCTLI
jgi:hypothetical protein